MVYLTKSNSNNTIIYETEHICHFLYFTFMWYILLCIIYLISFNPQRNTVRRGLLIPFYRWENSLREVIQFPKDEQSQLLAEFTALSHWVKLLPLYTLKIDLIFINGHNQNNRNNNNPLKLCRTLHLTRCFLTWDFWQNVVICICCLVWKYSILQQRKKKWDKWNS